MANYYAFCRSNYFRVKDYKAFEDWVGSFDGNLEIATNSEGMVALLGSGESGWPSDRVTARGDYDDVNFHAELAEHLQEKSIAVLMEVGYEKLRYLVGVAVALNHKGETVDVGLNDIYREALEAFGDDCEVTKAEY